MNVAVTGGSGFVGMWLRMTLEEYGMQPVTLDSRPPTAGAYRKANVMSLTELANAMGECDAVVHLAAISNTQDALANPSRCFAVNVLGTEHVIEAAARRGVKHVIVASSSLVSGQQVPFEMRSPPTDDGNDWPEWVVDELSPFQIERTTHPYVASKIAAEAAALSMAASFDINVTVVRLGIMYGEYMTPGVLFEIFLRNALKGEPLTIEGEGQQWRQYLHAEDTAEALVRILQRPDECRQEIFNLTPMRRTTVADVAEAFSKAVPRTVVRYGPERKNDIAVRFCMATKAQQKLDWEPKIGLTKGVERLVGWAKTQ